MASVTVGVVGAGGAGAYFAGRWAEAGLDVTLLARGRQLDAIAADGLRLSSPQGDATVELKATGDPSALGRCEVLLFATKTWQLEEAARTVAAAIDSSPVVFGVQNGVESVDVLSRSFARENVLGGTCRIISMVDSPGVIRHVGIDPTIVVGESGGGASDRVERLATALGLGPQLSVVASSDVVLELWKKFLFFAPVSAVGSVTRATIGELRSVAETRVLLHEAMAEVFELGRKLGVDFDHDTVTQTASFVDSLPPNGTSSMQRDFEAGKRTELESLPGYVTRLGRELGVPTPVHDLLYAALLPQELSARD